ncbi:hypothetical protein RAH32_00810 [Paracoccus sp. WLY502]|uniref:hypothetical protein n=1 Tax=Paracoccus yibinensis TaxID=3068891 RepID=UPI0027967D60|nr:hypothetical protein [Paracoccus sp. WLY502]MDQ1898988.1 hypothetical protein [Paracoccus sp. WLY502]
MSNKTLGFALAGASGLFLATASLAQTVVETPGGNTAVVVDPALQPQPPVGAVAVPAFPLPEQINNDQVVIETLLSQGFTNIHILREGAIMTITAQRNGQPTELVYSIANGTLISVDGVELREQPDATSNRGSDIAKDVLGAGSGGTDAGDDGEEDAGTGAEAGSNGADAGSPGAGTDGGSDGSGSGSESGADGGADGGSTGSDGGSDGAGSGG